ncbi:MAG: BrnT family toxin [Acidobacteriota bacterium]|nr:BrnT family toxin [Acidobacteriota bacterium]
MEFSDPDHSGDEERFLLIGRSYRLRVLLVCHCFRENDGEIRIISARRATAKERGVYVRDRR